LTEGEYGEGTEVVVDGAKSEVREDRSGIAREPGEGAVVCWSSVE